jgi:methylmalonyl-CoA mutase N-terminal domain/subunit
VAKFRAARRLWATLMSNEFGAKKPGTLQMKMIAGGGGGGLTIEQPENNIVRGAYYALISALSGAQTMALCSYDEAYTIPTEKAALISLRTMQILVEEMGLCDTADPLGGSYYVESLTNEMEQRIVHEMQRVDQEMGGIVRAVSDGAVQREVAKQAWKVEQGLQNGSIPKVGVNRYRLDASQETREVELHSYQAAQATESIRRTREIRAQRDQAAVAEALKKVREAAANDQNVMPVMMDAVRVYATLGEITQALKSVFGEFKEPVRL